jgi:hypothetical protein
MSAEAILSLTATALTALALVAVAISVRVQIRQSRVAEVQAVRTQHMELFRMAFDHPDLQAGWGHEIDVPNSEWRITAYTNLTFTYFLMGYDIGHWPAGELRQILEKRFRFQADRDYWRSAAPAFRAMRSPRRPSFYAVAQSAYDKAIQSPPVVGPRPADTATEGNQEIPPVRNSEA